jgi:cytochrome c biogenesis protein CcdA/thiol-disulfide isomerase/thioredoxin
MVSTVFVLFVAGLLTILLPCILPLVPIVLGVSIAGKNKWRPLVTILGMLIGFVGSIFLLDVLLGQFVQLADYIRIATYDILLLFGLGFLFHKKIFQWIGAILGGFFFWDKGVVAVAAAMIFGIIAMEIGGRVATWIQQAGTDIQSKVRGEFGESSLLSTFLIGLTMGLVWVPCAGPALSFALTVVRDQPGLLAALYLTAYAVGAAIPLLLIGYGGQYALRSARVLTKYSERIKQISGVLLILSAIGLALNLFQNLQTWAADNTGFGNLGNDIEVKLFGNQVGTSSSVASTQTSSDSSASFASSASLNAHTPVPSSLPVIGKAPADFVGTGQWFNSAPLHLSDLRGKVVLVDFWTYSCINCIRTLPYMEAYWTKYKGTPFVLIGVHTPEFTFEKDPTNVAMAIKEHGLTYPVVQDNDYGTWTAFNNEYWPAKYLIDAQGNIRYEHFGEGNYQETDDAIASLLGEIGASASDMSLPSENGGSGQPITPETYLHSRGWNSFGNASGAPDATVHTYALPSAFKLNDFYLGGTWQLVNDERQVLQSDTGELTIRALAGEVNLVLGLENGSPPAEADVIVDGKVTKSISIDRHDLFNLYKGDYGDHVITLKIHGKGTAAYAYTFGS